jgi:hypothetical protein
MAAMFQVKPFQRHDSASFEGEIGTVAMVEDGGLRAKVEDGHHPNDIAKVLPKARHVFLRLGKLFHIVSV